MPYKYIAMPIPLTAPSQVWVCERSLSGIVGSNPVVVMEVCFFRALCVVR